MTPSILNSFFSGSRQKSVKSETQEKDGDNRLPSLQTQCAFDTQPVSMIGILFVWRKKNQSIWFLLEKVFFLGLKWVYAAKFQHFLFWPVGGAAANIFCRRPCLGLQCLVQNVFIVWRFLCAFLESKAGFAELEEDERSPALEIDVWEWWTSLMVSQARPPLLRSLRWGQNLYLLLHHVGDLNLFWTPYYFV